MKEETQREKNREEAEKRSEEKELKRKNKEGGIELEKRLKEC
jgi:hypothetical protein